MNKRIKVTLNDEEYQLIKGKWYDSHFIAAPLNLAITLAEQVLNCNMKEFSTEDLETLIMGFKEQELTAQALRISDELYDRYALAADTYKLRWLMPIVTSLLRMSGVPRKAIEYYETQTSKFGNTVNSPQILTSIAAAYCDIADYDKAKQLCNWAYKWGGSSIELSKVYERIRNATA